MRPQRKAWPGKRSRAVSSPCRNGCAETVYLAGIDDEETAVAAASVGVIVAAAAVNLAFLGGLVYLGYHLGKK